MKDKGKWFKTDDLRTLIARAQDFFNVDLGYLVDKLLELERLAEIGKATEKAFNYIPKNHYQYNVFSLGELQEEKDFSFYSKEDLLNWAESEESNES